MSKNIAYCNYYSSQNSIHINTFRCINYYKALNRVVSILGYFWKFLVKSESAAVLDVADVSSERSQKCFIFQNTKRSSPTETQFMCKYTGGRIKNMQAWLNLRTTSQYPFAQGQKKRKCLVRLKTFSLHL